MAQLCRRGSPWSKPSLFAGSCSPHCQQPPQPRCGRSAPEREEPAHRAFGACGVCPSLQGGHSWYVPGPRGHPWLRRVCVFSRNCSGCVMRFWKKYFSDLILVTASTSVPKTWTSWHIAKRRALISVLPCTFRKQRVIFLWYGTLPQLICCSSVSILLVISPVHF